MGTGSGDEAKVRAQLAGLTEQQKLVGADHIVHGLTGEQIASLRGLSLRTVRRNIESVYRAIDRSGARRPAPIRSSPRRTFAGFSQKLAYAL